MRRDLDLVRLILLELVTRPSPQRTGELTITEHAAEEVSCQVEIMAQAGLITALDLSTRSGYKWQLLALTWAGYDFLDAARENTRWAKAKSFIAEQTGSVSFEVLNALLTTLAKQARGLPS